MTKKGDDGKNGDDEDGRLGIKCPQHTVPTKFDTFPHSVDAFPH